MAYCLKRSLSSSNLQSLSRRSSFSTLERTVSHSCVQTTPITVSSGLNNESFQEFYTYLNGEDHYKSANRLWENLPQTTRDIFVARVLDKKSTHNGVQTVDVLDGLKYDTAKELFVGQKQPTKNSYMHYRGKLAPHFYDTGRVKIDSATASKIIGRIYNQELSHEDKKRLKEDTMKEYENIVRDRLYTTKQFIARNERSASDDAFLAAIEKWSEKHENQRIEQIANLLKKVENTKEHLNRTSSKKKGILNAISRKSRKFVNVFSMKK